MANYLYLQKNGEWHKVPCIIINTWDIEFVIPNFLDLNKRLFVEFPK